MKLGRFAAARGIAGFWMAAMGDDKAEVKRYLNGIDERMKRERWNDTDPQHSEHRRGQTKVNHARIRNWSFAHAAQREATA